jgi:hypothetical protein
MMGVPLRQQNAMLLAAGYPRLCKSAICRCRTSQRSTAPTACLLPAVAPANAGAQKSTEILNSRLRGNDDDEGS